jgi:hypothetical protein
MPKDVAFFPKTNNRTSSDLSGRDAIRQLESIRLRGHPFDIVAAVGREVLG